MKRILQALACGVLLIGVLLAALLTGDWLVGTNRYQPPAAVEALIAWTLGWPVLLFDRFLPEAPSVETLTAWRIALSAVVDVIVYSLLAYLILKWRARKACLA